MLPHAAPCCPASSLLTPYKPYGNRALYWLVPVLRPTAGERSETGKAFERVGSTLSDAGRSVGSGVQDATATMTDQAGLGMQQAANSLAGNMRQATGGHGGYDNKESSS